MRLLGSLIFWTLFVVSVATIFLVATVVFLLTAPFDRKRTVIHLFSCLWGHFYFFANPLWSLRVEGREKLPWGGPAVYVANHQSLGDILVLFALYRPYKWVSKESVFRVPFIGWLMRYDRYIPIRRGDKASIAKMMEECRYWLDQDVPVLMFPEGTRSETGEMKPFKDGAFRLAVEKDCPVFPMVVTGTGDTLPKHGIMLRKRAHCRVRVLDPVHPRDYGHDIDQLRQAVRDVMVEEKARIEGRAPQLAAA